MSRTPADVFKLANELDSAIKNTLKQPSEPQAVDSSPVLDISLTQGTRRYIELVGIQINSSYLATAYDGCAVLIRRLLETLLVESFIHHQREHLIKQGSDFRFLNELIDVTLAQSDWQMGRNVRKGLKSLKSIGDLSAHARHYNARRDDIDSIRGDLRVVVERCLYLAGYRK